MSWSWPKLYWPMEFLALEKHKNTAFYALVLSYHDNLVSSFRMKENSSIATLFKRLWFLKKSKGWVWFLSVACHVESTTFSMRIIFSTVVQLEVQWTVCKQYCVWHNQWMKILSKFWLHLLENYYQTVSFSASVLSKSCFLICLVLQAILCQLGPPLLTPLLLPYCLDPWVSVNRPVVKSWWIILVLQIHHFIRSLQQPHLALYCPRMTHLRPSQLSVFLLAVLIHNCRCHLL